MGIVGDENHQARADFASPLVVVLACGVHDGKGGQKAVQIQAQLHFRGRFAPPMLGPVDAVEYQFHHRGIDRMDTDAKPPQQSTAAPPGRKRWVQALQMLEGSPEKRLHELRGPHFVGMRETVARRRNRAHSRQGCRFQPQPVAEIIQPHGVRQLRENHRAQVAEYGKVPRLGLRPDQRSRNVLEQLFENDNVGSGWWFGFCFHTLPCGRAQDRRQPIFFSCSMGRL